MQNCCIFFRAAAAVAEAYTDYEELGLALLNVFDCLFPKERWGKEDFYIEFGGQYGTFKFEKKPDNELFFSMPQGILGTGQKIGIRMGNLKNGSDEDELICMLPFGGTQKPPDYFVPDTRGRLALLGKNGCAFPEETLDSDPRLEEFCDLYNDLRKLRFKLPEEAQKLVEVILQGAYLPDEEAVQQADGRKVPVTLPASEQKEVFPIVLVLIHVLSYLAKRFGINLYIEEPESKLAPDGQEALVRLMSFAQHKKPKRAMSFVLTTHSPQLLAAFNNLIQAGNVVKRKSSLKNAVCDIIPKSMHIDIDHFSAYHLEDGKATNLIDTGNNLIRADAIDTVSERTAEVFGKLMDIECFYKSINIKR